MSADVSFEFDELRVASLGKPVKSVEPPVLLFDKNCVVAGAGANWCIRFANLEPIADLTEHAQRNTRWRNELISLKLQDRGRKRTIIECNLLRDPRSTRRIEQLKAFFDGLKNAHRKAVIKGLEKDPYNDQTSKSRGRAPIRGRSLGTGSTTTKRSRGMANGTSPTNLTPKKRRFHSLPQQRKRHAVGFDFDDSPQTPQLQRTAVRGNGATSASPVAQIKLELPPTPPLNATATKIGQNKSDDENTSSPYKERAQSQVTSALSNEVHITSEDGTDNEEGEDNRGTTSTPIAESNQKSNKRRLRLQKRRNILEDNNCDSDEEFPADPIQRNSYTKKRFAIEEDVDDDFDENDEVGSMKTQPEEIFCQSSASRATSPSPTPIPQHTEDVKNNMVDKNSSKSVTDDEEGVNSPPATITLERSKSSIIHGDSEEGAPERITSASTNLTKKITSKINKFFAPRSKPQVLAESSSPVPSHINSVPISSPPKETINSTESPCTPPRSTKQSPATKPPLSAPKQMSCSRLFPTDERRLESASDGNGYTLDYASEEDIPDMIHQPIPNSKKPTNRFGGHIDVKATARPGPRYPNRNIYGSRGQRVRSLGQSRLAARNSPAQRLSFTADRGNCKTIEWRGSESEEEHGTSGLNTSRVNVSPISAKRGLKFVPIESAPPCRTLTPPEPLTRLLTSTEACDKPHPHAVDHVCELPPKSQPANRSVSPQQPHSIPGIQNLGNTCYLSASLQTLFGIPRFFESLRKTYSAGPTHARSNCNASVASCTVQEEPSVRMPLTKALLEVASAVGVLPDCSFHEAAPVRMTSTTAVNPVALKNKMDAITDKFVGYEQRDAHEFLSDLVDFLHDELVAATSRKTLIYNSSKNGRGIDSYDDTDETDQEDSESSGDNATPVIMEDEAENHDNISLSQTGVPPTPQQLPTDEFFHLTVRVCLQCDTCGYSRSKDELYRHLSVEVGEDSNNDDWTVERSLKQFFQPEKRELKCEKCEDGNTATQTMTIISRPRALLLHFKRFIVTQEPRCPSTPCKQHEADEVSKPANTSTCPPVMEMVLRKNKVKIPLNESLSIDQYFDPDIEFTAAAYRLCGVVHHIGSTAFSGHYTSCSKRRLEKNEASSDSAGNPIQDSESLGCYEQWAFFDDRVGVRKTLDYVTNNDRNQRNCYMALYELE